MIPEMGLLGICAMQVCAVRDATDEEILAACNSENPAGTTNGWASVVRESNPEQLGYEENKMPAQCADDENRLHLLVYC
jgi:hypothetical protein